MKLTFRVETNAGKLVSEAQQFFWLPAKGAKVTVADCIYVVVDIIQYEYQENAELHGLVQVRDPEPDYMKLPFLDSPTKSRSSLRTVSRTGDNSQRAELKKGLKT